MLHTLANKITILRIMLIPFLIIVTLSYRPEKDYLRWVAFAIFFVAAVSDLIDGYIARSRHQETKIGAILDSFADKLLLISSFICLYKVSVLFTVVQFPAWLVVASISHDIIILLGIVVIHMLHKDLSIKPTILGKLTTFFQVLCVLGLLIQWPLAYIIWYVALGFIIVSLMDYVRIGIGILKQDVAR